MTANREALEKNRQYVKTLEEVLEIAKRYYEPNTVESDALHALIQQLEGKLRHARLK